jgi:selenocysteine-specific elongation factor
VSRAGLATDRGRAPEPALHVVATAGHVDHGKSALVLRLTGMDPDRLAEEKRRGLTIDLGFAWTTLPSGAEIGFVDVPGHERFVRNMLAGVGPVRLVLFVVAADEGWKPQSEEHLQILDVLGTEGAVVALTKADLVDADVLTTRRDEVRRRVAGTRLEGAPVVECSAATGVGLEELLAALDAMVAAAPPPPADARPRQFIDRVFTIRGAGTVVTGTLTGGPLEVGQEVEVLPSGLRARIRGLQTHKRALSRAVPVSRVAVNLAATATGDLDRGDVLAPVGRWRATSTFEGLIRPVRGLARALSSRGAYKVHVGSAERDARLLLYGTRELAEGAEAFLRITLSRAVVLDVGDPFVLREAGRRETVGGGVVLNADPPARPGEDPVARLSARIGADRARLARLVVAERGAVRSAEIPILVGAQAEAAQRAGALRLGAWIVDPERAEALGAAVRDALASHHERRPLEPGLELAHLRSILEERPEGRVDAGLADALIEHLVAQGTVARDGTTVRLAERMFSTRGRPDVDRLVADVEAGEPTPPSMAELAARGFSTELVRAAVADGRLVRVSREIVVTPALLHRAERLVRELAGSGGVTVSVFREALGTSRKYALPILEFLDAKGVTRREGAVRMLRRT